MALNLYLALKIRFKSVLRCHTLFYFHRFFIDFDDFLEKCKISLRFIFSDMEIKNIVEMSIFALIAIIMICSFAIPLLVNIIQIDGAQLMTGLTPVLSMVIVVLIVCAIRGIVGYTSARR